jgi:hypothetical protein
MKPFLLGIRALVVSCTAPILRCLNLPVQVHVPVVEDDIMVTLRQVTLVRYQEYHGAEFDACLLVGAASNPRRRPPATGGNTGTEPVLATEVGAAWRSSQGSKWM